jgi:hypothetical protein
MTAPRDVQAPQHILAAVHAASGASDDWLSAALRERGVIVGRHGVGRLRRGEVTATLGFYWHALHCLGPRDVAVALGVFANDFGLQVVGRVASGDPVTLPDVQRHMNRTIGRLLICMTQATSKEPAQLVTVLMELRHLVDQALHLVLGDRAADPRAPRPLSPALARSR